MKTIISKKSKASNLKMSLSERAGVTLVHIFLVLLSAMFILPFIYLLSVSFSSDFQLATYGTTLIPKDFSADAYIFLSSYSERLLRSYMNTIIIAISTTLLMIVVTSMFAYPLSKKDFVGRKAIMMYVLFSMLFGGGLVPYYLSMGWYGFSGTWLSLILPGCFSAWNMILMRNYFTSLPQSIEESAFIDGAGYFTILFRIVLPLSKPILATLSLFTIVGVWNNWYSALLFLSKTRDLWPIMMFLKSTLEAVNPATTMGMPASSNFPPTESLKMATVVLSIAPIIVTYPFLQKYFVKGIMIGSIKG